MIICDPSASGRPRCGLADRRSVKVPIANALRAALSHDSLLQPDGARFRDSEARDLARDGSDVSRLLGRFRAFACAQMRGLECHVGKHFLFG